MYSVKKLFLDVRVAWNKANAKRNSRRRAREKAMRADKELKRFLADVITSAMEDAVYVGRYSRSQAEGVYKQIALSLEIPDLLHTPQGQLKTKDIRAMKKELRVLRKAVADRRNGVSKPEEGVLNQLEDKIVKLSGRSRLDAILKRTKAA